MRIILFTLIFSSLVLTSCNNNTNTANKNENATKINEPKAAPQSKLGEDGTKKLVTLLTYYYDLKDAFIATNATKADAAGSKLLQSADSLSVSLQHDSINTTILKPYLDTLNTETKKMIALKDESCESKRLNFSKISEQVYAIAKLTGIKNIGIYQQHCPMAFNEKGANWLSNETDIKNPYYGKKMLECGEIIDSLK